MKSGRFSSDLKERIAEINGLREERDKQMAKKRILSGEERSGQRNNARRDTERYERQLAFSARLMKSGCFAQFECESGKEDDIRKKDLKKKSQMF